MENIEKNSTIFALSSGSIPSGIGVIRVSGPKALSCISILTGKSLNKPRVFELRNFIHPETKQFIDQGLVVWFKEPNSFTGEDVIELHTHGSAAIIDLIYEVLGNIEHTRIAEPGEFTKRAFYNNKLNLDQVEGLVDVINAETNIQLQHANALLLGNLGNITESIRDRLITLLSKIEASIEFEDDGVFYESSDIFNDEIKDIQNIIYQFLESYKNSEIIRNGFIISIVGPPNVGKSSIINRLANSEKAIISNIPGTTRDIIEVKIKLFGYPVIFRDTAGIRDTENFIETMGIKKTYESINESNLVLFINDFDSITTNSLNYKHLLSDKTVLDVFNKSDLLSTSSDESQLFISAKTGQGFEKLLHEIKLILNNNFDKHNSDSIFLTRKRHYEIFNDILNSLNRFLNEDNIELKAEDLRLGIRFLGQITGRVSVEDMLDKLFLEFCIGK